MIILEVVAKVEEVLRKENSISLKDTYLKILKSTIDGDIATLWQTISKNEIKEVN